MATSISSSSRPRVLLRRTDAPPDTAGSCIAVDQGASVLLGRNRLTNIAEPASLSREQVRFTASAAGGCLEQIGRHAAAVDGAATVKGMRYELQHGSHFALLHAQPDRLRFRVEVDTGSDRALAPPSPAADKPVSSPKRARTESSDAAPACSRPSALSFSHLSPTYKKDAVTLRLPADWYAHKTLLLRAFGTVEARAKIAAFDFDGCLARTSFYQKGPDAWTFMFPSVPTTLQRLHANGFKIVIFSNESLDRLKAADALDRQIASKTGRVAGLVAKAGVPVQAVLMTRKDAFRKPNTSAWDFLASTCNGGLPVALHASFYVGDAAGRPGDHSSDDRDFAQRIGLVFHNERDFFEGGAAGAYLGD